MRRSPNPATLQQVGQAIGLLSAQAMLRDELWRFFGFRKRPRRGQWFDRFVSELRFAKEQSIKREVQVIFLSRYIKHVINKRFSGTDRSLVLAFALELLVDGNYGPPWWRILDFPTREQALEFYAHGGREYLLASETACGATFLTRTKDIMNALDEKDRGTWTVGAIKMCVDLDMIFGITFAHSLLKWMGDEKIGSPGMRPSDEVLIAAEWILGGGLE